MSKQNTAFHTSLPERMSYGVYFFGQAIFFMLISGFLQLYMTEIGIPALVVGGIFFAAKIWDAINDPIFGVIVDKSNLKKGKYIPWIRLSSFLIAITTVLLFAVPAGVSVQIKVIWVTVAYLLWDTSYTICDVPIFALATSMTEHINERDWLYLLNRFFLLVGGLTLSITLPLLYPAIGWTPAVIILSVIGLATMIPVGYKAKERFYTENEKSPRIRELASYLIHNKPLLIFNLAVVVMSLTNTAAAVQNYVAIYCLGGPQWISIMALISVLPMLVAIPVVRKMLSKVDKRNIFLGFSASSFCLGIAIYFIGYQNLGIYFTIAVIRAFLSSGATILVVMFTADCSEYGNYKTGERAQGVAFSIQTFSAKITMALSTAIGMTLLGLFGFVEGTGAVQTPQTIQRIWAMSTVFPAISGSVALLIILLFYKLRQRDVAVMMRLNAGEISREEAQSQFSRTY